MIFWHNFAGKKLNKKHIKEVSLKDFVHSLHQNNDNRNSKLQQVILKFTNKVSFFFAIF